jgi:Flp pilus assembly protein TadG
MRRRSGSDRQMNRRQMQRGGALVEFAVVAPVMLIFLFAIVNFGIAMFEYHATQYAAKVGARYASVRGANCTVSGCPITTAGLQTYVRGAVPGAGNATVIPAWNFPDSTNYTGFQNVATACGSTSESRGCFVTVSVSNPISLNIPFVFNHNVTFNASSTVPVTQ